MSTVFPSTADVIHGVAEMISTGDLLKTAPGQTYSTPGLPTVDVFGIQVHRVTLKESVQQLRSWISEDEKRCHFVVTPNLDHAVQFQKNENFRKAYAAASLVVADGWPLVTASKMTSTPLPERVAGSDLVPALFRSFATSAAPARVFLLGAAPGVAEIAAEKIHQKWLGVKVVGTYSPPLGFETDDVENERIIERVNQCAPDILIVGFGAPKQELWLSRHHARLQAGIAIAGGATIDFLAGRQTRAPRWMQKMKLEWSHRLLTNPGRLSKRYAHNALHLPLLLLKSQMKRKQHLRGHGSR